MTYLDAVQRLVDGHVGADPDRRDDVFGYLADQPDRGVPAAFECLLKTNNEQTAEYMAQYLGLVPAEAQKKTEAAERLRRESKLAPSAAWLIPWLPAQLIDGFIADYLEAGEPDSPLADVLYEIGVCFPERLRPFERQIDDEYVQQALLAGGPDSTADSLLAAWRDSREPEPLTAMALMRTDRAVHNILEIRDELEDSDQWETLLELAGRLPDTDAASGFWPAFMALVTEHGATGHTVGGVVTGEAPCCGACGSPAALLVRLAAAELPYGLVNDPEFYWYACDCEESDSLTVRSGHGELLVYDGQKAAADPEASVGPGGKSLVLETHPNQVGVSLQGTPGSSSHQVGGLPRWAEPDSHPVCPECDEAMPYLMTMDCGKTRFGEMAYDGTLYCFWCDGCRVSSTRIQY